MTVFTVMVSFVTLLLMSQGRHWSTDAFYVYKNLGWLVH